MSLVAKIFPSESEARAEIAAIDAAEGYPRTEVARRIGRGRHVATITTLSACEPIPLDDSTWAVDAARAARAGRDVSLAREVSGQRRERVEIDVVADAKARARQ